MNCYELVFADTGAYPYPQGITSGNFRPNDVGDVDRDSLTDLVGPNIDKQLSSDIEHNVITTQESPNYSLYPENLSWWYRYSNNQVQSAPFYCPPNLDQDNWKELLFLAEGNGITHIFENIGNNQNQLVWSRYQVGAWSFAFMDFDLDSAKEFATANLGSSGRVSVYENSGPDQYEMTYQDTVYLPNGSDVFSGNDLDQDGKPEFFVAFADAVSNIFYLYMWEAIGNNTYQRYLIAQKQYSVSTTTGRRSKCGDLDGDGIEELVWATPTRLYVYKATANNQFQQVWEWWQDHGTDEALITNIYDMNKNGYNEIIVGGSGKTSIFEVEAVRLLRPNGGEVFQDSTQEIIHWQKFYPPRCDSLSLFYSIDNGRTYQSIVHSLQSSDTSYVWSVPSVNSDSCKVKIIAYGPGWQYDESDGVFSITSTGVEEHSPLSAHRYSLKVYPNPAKSVMRVQYSIPSPSPKPSPIKGEGLTKVSIQLFDISGRLVKTFVNEYKKPGNYSLTLNSKTLSAGVYFLSLATKEKRIIERVIIIK